MCNWQRWSTTTKAMLYMTHRLSNNVFGHYVNSTGNYFTVEKIMSYLRSNGEHKSDSEIRQDFRHVFALQSSDRRRRFCVEHDLLYGYGYGYCCSCCYWCCIPRSIDCSACGAHTNTRVRTQHDSSKCTLINYS